MYQLTLTQAGINRGANFDAVLAGIKPHIVRASTYSFGSGAGNINFNNIVQVVAGPDGTIIVRFPWAAAQQANLRQRITEALQNAQRGELSTLGQITLIELPGDVRGETAAPAATSNGSGNASQTPTAEITDPSRAAPVPGPAPTRLPLGPYSQTKIGNIVQSGGLFSDTVLQVEVRANNDSIFPSTIQQAIAESINSYFGNNDDNRCILNNEGTGYLCRYADPTVARLAVGHERELMNPGPTQESIYALLRTALDSAQSMLGQRVRLLLPTENGYETAIRQNPVQPNDPNWASMHFGLGSREQRAAERAQGLNENNKNFYSNQQTLFLSTRRMQQLAGILKEQNSSSLGTAFTRQPAASATATASRPTATPTAPIAPVARPVAAAPAPPNPNVNRMIDQAIQNARRIAPQVTQLASNPAYSANRQKLQQLAQYLTGEFISSMNAAKNAPDTASKLRAVQAIYTPPNRGALLSNGLFDLGRLAASERR